MKNNWGDQFTWLVVALVIPSPNPPFFSENLITSTVIQKAK